MCRGQFGLCRQRSRADSCKELDIPDIEIDKHNDVPKEKLIFIAKWVDAVRQNQTLFEEPTVETPAFVSIA